MNAAAPAKHSSGWAKQLPGIFRIKMGAGNIERRPFFFTLSFCMLYRFVCVWEFHSGITEDYDKAIFGESFFHEIKQNGAISCANLN